VPGTVEDSTEHQHAIPAITFRKLTLDLKKMGTKERTPPDNKYIWNGGLWLWPGLRLML